MLTKNADLQKRVSKLELELASANAALHDKDGELLGIKRLLESANG